MYFINQIKKVLHSKSTQCVDLQYNTSVSCTGAAYYKEQILALVNTSAGIYVPKNPSQISLKVQVNEQKK